MSSSNSSFYTKRYGSSPKPQKSVPQQEIIYTQAEDKKGEKTIYTDIIYTAMNKCVKPSEIFDSVRRTAPEVFGTAGLDDSIMLELFSDAVIEFKAKGDRKWDFLTADTVLKLKPGQLKYPLPSNYDQMISVFFERGNKLCCKSEKDKTRRVEVVRRDEQDKDFAWGQNYYSVKNGVLEFINLGLKEKLDKCGHCCQCDACDTVSGDVSIHYHINPPLPQKKDDEMCWFPSNPSAIKYFKEVMLEKMYRRQGSLYQSPTADLLFMDLQKWDNNYFSIDNKPTGQKKFIDFTKMYKKR